MAGMDLVCGFPADRLTGWRWCTISSGSPSARAYLASARVISTRRRRPRDEQGEREPGQAFGEPGREADGPVLQAQAAEAGDQRDPGACQGGEVDLVAGVVLKVVQVDQGGLAEVVVGQV
jgi:hypothetical protein